MSAHVPVALGGSTRGLTVRQQRAERRRLERVLDARVLSEDERLRLGVLRERERLRAYRRGLRKGGRQAPSRETGLQTQMPIGGMGLRALAEMAALHARSRLGDLSNAESEKLGQLVLREQRLSRGRGMLIARVRAVLAMLEDLEIAERGGLDVPAPGRTIEHRAEAA